MRRPWRILYSRYFQEDTGTASQCGPMRSDDARHEAHLSRAPARLIVASSAIALRRTRRPRTSETRTETDTPIDKLASMPAREAEARQAAAKLAKWWWT
jgi:hypothetical protein